MKRVVATFFVLSCGSREPVQAPKPVAPDGRPEPSSTLPPLPPVGSLDAGAPAHATGQYRREEDVVFQHRSVPLKLVSIQKDRTTAWFTKDGKTTITSSGAKGSILAGGAIHPIDVADGFFVVFAPDEGKAAIIQARAPLTVVSVPAGKLTFDRGQGRECGVRWSSASTLVFHDDENDAFLWKLDLATKKTTRLGEKRRADQCWGSSDGKRWFVRDDFAKKGGVVWKVDGDTGAATIWLEAVDDITATPDGGRLCYHRGDGVFCRAENEAEERVTDDGAELALDDTGRSLLFSTRGVYFVADTKEKTVRALSGARLKSGGTVALLSGGRIFVAGSGQGVDVFDLDAKTTTTLAGGSLYGVKAIPGRPRAVVVEKEVSSGHDIYLLEIP